MIGTQGPVTVGWENIPKVVGGPVKLFIFTWFQPFMLFALIAFWYYAPNSIAKASTAVVVGIGFELLLLGLEWLNPRSGAGVQRRRRCLARIRPSHRRRGMWR